MIRSANGTEIPFTACSPPTRAMISAVTPVIGWMGTYCFSSSRKRRRCRAFSAVAAWWTPCPNSATVKAQITIGTSPAACLRPQSERSNRPPNPSLIPSRRIPWLVAACYTRLNIAREILVDGSASPASFHRGNNLRHSARADIGRADDRHWLAIPLNDNLAAQPDLFQNRRQIARQFRLADVYCSHIIHHTLSRGEKNRKRTEWVLNTFGGRHGFAYRRGRDSGCPLPPAQTRACGATAHGSYFGFAAARRLAWKRASGNS